MKQLICEDVTVTYPQQPDTTTNAAVKNISFSLKSGSVGCLLGPSGSGKTSLLRAIAGFEKLSHGKITLDGKMISDAGHQVAPEDRKIGMMFQDYALFPHLTVWQNIAFGLRNISRTDQEKRINKLLKLTNLHRKANAYTHQLSGGEQQRVALARAMAPRPKLLLMDEPFSNMDTELRESMSKQVRELLRLDGISGLIVTHDQQEAFSISDEIGIINNGSLMQWDTPYTLYHKPKNHFIAKFVGQGVFLEGNIIGKNKVKTELGDLSGKTEGNIGDKVDVLLRPDDIIHDDDSPTKFPITHRHFRGAEYMYNLQLPSKKEILCLVPSHHNHPPGEALGVRIDMQHLVIFQKPQDK